MQPSGGRGGPTLTLTGQEIAFIYDPDGYWIEILADRHNVKHT